MEPTSFPENVEQIQHNGVRWINLEYSDKSSLEYLKREFSFHALDFEDIIGITHRSKIDKYETYIFLVMLFPLYNRKNRQIEPAEIDFFLGTDYLIAVHRDDIPTYVDMFQLCQTSDQACESTMKDSPQFLLYKILQRLFHYCYPIMDQIDLQIDDMENKLFESGSKKLLQEILFVRHNIIDMRKIMQPHRTVLSRLKKTNAPLTDEKHFELEKKYDVYFDDILDSTKEIWNQLESFKEATDALHQTNESLISYRINETMRTLTVFSALMLPASVVASIFGMNADYIPFAAQPNGFYIMISLTLLAIIGTLFYIRHKHLL